MDFTEEYARAIAYVIKVMDNKGKQRLYDAHDVVHNVYLECGNVSLKKVKARLLSGALYGVIHSCCSFSINGQLYYGPQQTNYVYGEYDEKKCTKCKLSKIIIIDFRRITTTRHCVPYSYYQAECKDCEAKRKKTHRANAVVRNNINEYNRKFNKDQAKQLSDRYIKRIIAARGKKDGKFIKYSDITQQEIAQARQELIAKRAKQIQKGRNKE